jgi:tetratricopeptide (TPR) repeat protein
MININGKVSASSCALIIVFLFLTLFSTMLYADSKKLAQGMAHMRARNWQKAEQTFLAILTDDPNQPDAQALLGMTRYHMSKYASAVVDMEIALKQKTKYAARSLYYLGLCRIKLGQKEKAEDTFTRLILAYPTSQEARQLGVVPADIETSIRKREGFEIDGTIITAKAGYDSNPAQTSGGDSDFFIDIYLSTDLTLGRSAWVASGSAFIEKYISDTDNDFMSLAVDLSHKAILLNSDLLKMIFEIERSWYGGDESENRIGAWLIHERQWDPAWHSQSRLGYDASSDLTDSAESLDANSYSSRLRLTRKCRESQLLDQIRIDTEWVSEDCDTDYWGYNELSAGVEWRFMVKKNTSLDFEIEYSQRKYGAVHPDEQVTRDDSSITVAFYFMRPINNKTYMTAQLSHDMRDSNISDYETDQTRLSAGILYIP